MEIYLIIREDSKLTRNSLIIENLWIAADNPCYTHKIFGKIFDSIIDGSHKPISDKDNLYLCDVANVLAYGELDQF